MIREELKKLKTGPAELRKFGLTVGGVFAVLALWFWIRHKPAWPYLLAPAIPLLVLGVAWPTALRGVYRCWMAIAFAMGFVMSTLLLTLFFYLVVTPIGLIARLFGRDFLSQKLDRGAASYWISRATSPPRSMSDYERQF